MTSHDVERAYVAAMLDNADDRLAEATAAMRADLDRLADSWQAGVAQQLADHETRLAQIRDDQARWVNSLYGDDDEGPHELAGGQGDAPAGRNAPATPGPVPRQPDPHVAELAEAARLRAMSMNEYAALRAELGVESPTDLNRLFSREAR